MNKSVYGLLAAAALVGVTAAPANAAGDEGSASAAVLRASLEVSLLKGGAAVPLKTELNAVRAPESADETLLEARVDGVHGGKPFTMLDAKAATSKAMVEKGKAEGHSNLAEAEVYVPGLLRPLVRTGLVTSRAVCEAGARPTAESEIPGTVTVLGKKVAVKADGTTSVRVGGVGTVELKLAETVTTTRTAAATALRLDVAVDPANLGVAEVEGRVTLVEAACETPGGGGGGTGGSTGSTGGGSTGSTEGGSTGGGSADGGSTSGSGGSTGGSTEGSTGGDSGSAGSDGSTDGKGNDPRPQTGSESSGEKPTGNLAETGGSSATPYVAGGALALVAAGGGLLMLRRRRASGAADA
ncbi:LPXTG cell wall anchor domain-containing protein [Streptomyces sp. S1A]|uniref:SCO1860 family LAETG-anchored protein n=1 Tax=Streptomyces sp. ICN903 TaxID=2964654 RepID=UPI001EDB096C|nr:SCO1860 family LAETG-anchored protein [Streptomyces sp. ICN903]MCG3040133.1 LPXTG cell wall anchor domain-containing protein [Streptomyces sp. ICN903]